jgi:pimeloyl-ACP methyl ester carboxylesterase
MPTLTPGDRLRCGFAGRGHKLTAMSVSDPAAFMLRRAGVNGVELAYARVGDGGFPLLLIHGWPETRRIWWRNIAELAAAGFDVIAPDLRGFGDSGLAPDERYDVAAHSRDLQALLEELGHERCVVCAGDLGGLVAQDLSLRFDGLVDRMVLFNTIPPFVPEIYAAAGIGPEIPRETRQAADYFRRQSRDADGLAAELDTPERRRAYVADMYGPRFWAAPGGFDRAGIDFMTEPFADAEHFRASIANYEYVGGARRAPELPRVLEVNPTPTVVLYGPEDHVIPRDFPARMEAAFPQIIGPFTVPGAGHFLMWERPRVLNRTLEWFCRDLLGESRAHERVAE